MNQRIDLVDDEHDIIEIEKEMLEKLGYTVTATESSVDAHRLFSNHQDRFALVISDLTMPKMTGIELVKSLRELRSDVKFILCTGYSEGFSLDDARQLGIQGFILKPFSMTKIAAVVREVLDN